MQLKSLRLTFRKPAEPPDVFRKKYLWLTDIHLNFLKPAGRLAFCRLVESHQPDAVLLGGDIGGSNSVVGYLKWLANRLQCPIYFVLGNRDYNDGSINSVREYVREATQNHPYLVWLEKSGVIELSKSTALFGHGGWADGGYGKDWNPDVDHWDRDVEYRKLFTRLDDYYQIEDLRTLDWYKRTDIIKGLAKEAADHIRRWLPLALKQYKNVCFLTHVPPFRESCWYKGRILNDHWLPHFACKIVGDTLLVIMQKHRDRHLTVLCGHSHGGGEARILDNLIVYTGEARYGMPVVQKVFEW